MNYVKRRAIVRQVIVEKYGRDPWFVEASVDTFGVGGVLLDPSKAPVTVVTRGKVPQSVPRHQVIDGVSVHLLDFANAVRQRNFDGR